MNIFITICSCIVASIMTTLYCWKKFGKEEEERILQEQKERREKIRDSMLQTGSKRYSFPIDLKKASDWPFEEEVPLSELSDAEHLLHEIYIASGKLKLENITAVEAKQDLFRILIILEHKELVKRYNDIHGDDYHTRLFYIAHLEEDAKRSLERVYSSMIDIIKYGWLGYNDIYSNIIRILRMILDTSLEDIIQK